MLGSVHDAEDALQDALLRAWRGLARFEGRSSLRSWLYTIATNTCLDVIARRPKRVLPVDYGPAADPHDGPGRAARRVGVGRALPGREAGRRGRVCRARGPLRAAGSVELAFIAALQHLPANQRAVLILREVLGFSAREVAETLETTTASVNSALQRARAAVDERLPEQSQQATLRALGDEGLREVVDSYVDAWERSDVEAVVAMLDRGRRVRDAAAGDVVRGSGGSSNFLRRLAALGRLALARRADSRKRQPALGDYSWDEQEDLPSFRAQRADPSRRAGPGGNRLHHAVHRGSRSRGPGAVAGAARRSPAARGPFENFGLPDRLD